MAWPWHHTTTTYFDYVSSEQANIAEPSYYVWGATDLLLHLNKHNDEARGRGADLRSARSTLQGRRANKVIYEASQRL